MTPEQIALVQHSFADVAPHMTQAARLFYAHIFELDPSLRARFPVDMREQERKLMLTLDVAIASLDRLEEFVPMVYALGKRHANYGTQPRDYETLQHALIWMLGEILGESFTEETREAWNTIYSFLVETMLVAATPV